VRVVAIGDGGPAALGGLKTGDRILQVDGAPPPPRWPELIARKAAGAPLVLTVARGTRTLELHLTLESDRDIVCKLTQPPATPALAKLRDAFLTP
jgi:S1-C subfamily serine protease